MRPLSRVRLAGCIALVVGLVATAVGQPASSFSLSLPEADRASSGFVRLTAEQTASLDELIQRDIAAARQGDVVAFAKTFTARRTAEEREQAGLNRLSDGERAQLDRLVAGAIADRPARPYLDGSTVHRAPRVRIGKKELEVHGQVSAFYGQQSGGGSFYGGSVDVVGIDPAGRYMIGVGVSMTRSKGMRGCGFGPVW